MVTAARLKKSNLDLAGAVLPRANLSRTNLAYANLEGTNLSGADLSMAILVNARMKNVVLNSADLSHADLSEADLTNADLSGAVLSSAKLVSANLDRAKLNKADLRGANLKDAKGVEWSALLCAFLDERTIFPTELEGDSIFQYLERHIYLDRIDWRSEFNRSLREFLHQITEQNDRGLTISELLSALASQELREQESSNLGLREDDDR